MYSFTQQKLLQNLSYPKHWVYCNQQNGHSPSRCRDALGAGRAEGQKERNIQYTRGRQVPWRKLRVVRGQRQGRRLVFQCGGQGRPEPQGQSGRALEPTRLVRVLWGGSKGLQIWHTLSKKLSRSKKTQKRWKHCIDQEVWKKLKKSLFKKPTSKKIWPQMAL